MSIHETSRQLAVAGIKHIVVAFPKKEAVKTPDGWDAALDAFKDGVEKLVEQYDKDNSLKHHMGTKVTSEDALKFTKVYLNPPQGSRSIYCFIERSNGDILKPATATVPAKGARGSLFDQYNGLKRMGPYGPEYNK